MPFIVGITGSIGCGKSTVTQLLGEMGGLTLDADQLAKDLLTPDSLGWHQVVARFGTEILMTTTPPATKPPINRRLLAERVFTDLQARQDLEAIIHPQLYQTMATRLRQWETPPPNNPQIAILEIPLLFETNAQALCDFIVVVACGGAQWERLQTRTNLSSTCMKNMIAQQLPEAQKKQLAHQIIDNSQNPAHTRMQVQSFWKTLQQHAQNRQTSRAWPTAWQPHFV